MSKASLDLGDFTIATRSVSRTVAVDDTSTMSVTPAIEETERGEAAKDRDNVAAETAMLQKRSPEEREKRARDRAVAQEEARYSIKNLKRAKQRQVKFFVNVALDHAMKTRLKRAADENDIKMAAVMKAALDFYLKENGY
ncbi:hypothetical protein J2S28_005780 [Rhizobium sp. SLBN-94]|nr:hypothetical protein [Rhizobium sp. SLBN-94]